jgi:hypothetical protein
VNVREAAITVLKHEAFHIVQPGSHVYLLVEAARRKGLVFADRDHEKRSTSPAQARNV